MARRLASAVLTRPDTHIWLCINLPLKRKAPQPLPSGAYFAADRRDADLMLWRVEHVYHSDGERLTPRGWWHPL